MIAKLLNWRLWAGFGLSLVALTSYVLLVNVTQAVFWPSLLLSVAAAALLVSGLKRARREPQTYRGKIAGPILTTLGVLVFCLFGFTTYEISKAIPAARNAPQVGQRAPAFSLVDANGKNFSLNQMLATPLANAGGAGQATKGVLVFFYRGYW